MANTLFTYTSGINVAARKNIEWRGNNWIFSVEASRYVSGHTEHTRIELSRDEAMRLRGQLNVMLRATAPAKRR